MRDDLAGLHLDLERLGSATIYPPTPDLAARVRLRIASSTARAPAFPTVWSMSGAALAAAVLVMAVIVAVAPPARRAVADLFDRINIFSVEQVPGELTEDLGGRPVTLDEAQQRLGQRLLLPTGSDSSVITPSAVVYQQFRPTAVKAVTLRFEEGEVPFVIVETNAGLGKGLGPGATAEPVQDLGDGDAYWLQGSRIVQLYDAEGNFIGESQRRTDANTLTWVQDGLVLRLEGGLPLGAALDIARSMK